ncbi:unknown [Roseburia sp. CAG:100]|nr:unknown [Roseburia sp. CAG:100]
MAIKMISRVNPGIIIFENFSMPCSTPRYTIQAVKARKTSMNTIGDTFEVIKDVK